VKQIAPHQVQWLLQGLAIEQKTQLYPVTNSGKNICY
jgi:hypothetical protein